MNDVWFLGWGTMTKEGLADNDVASRLAGSRLNSNHHPHSDMSTNSSTTHVDVGSESDPPQLSALFLIEFDKKIG